MTAATEIPLTLADDHDDPEQRFRLYRLCVCDACEGDGRSDGTPPDRCTYCRGEGRTLDCFATAENEKGVGQALVANAREGMLGDCPFGLLDTQGEKGEKWLVSPWLPSPRNISDAAKVLRAAPRKGER